MIRVVEMLSLLRSSSIQPALLLLFALGAICQSPPSTAPAPPPVPAPATGGGGAIYAFALIVSLASILFLIISLAFLAIGGCRMATALLAETARSTLLSLMQSHTWTLFPTCRFCCGIPMASAAVLLLPHADG